MSTAELIPVPQAGRALMLSPVMNLQTANARLEVFQQFVAGYLQESRDGGQDGGDYGPIPGAGKKKVLLKSGADKLCELGGIYDEYSIESHENFETNLFFYRVKCILKSRADDSVVGTGLGSCSTWESKYRWRDSKRKCPACGSEAIIKGKDWKNDGLPTGWLCWEKKGGCGKKFKDGDESVEKQVLGRVENPDILDTVNTVLKMAKKRAKIDAVIGVTRSSGLFTQDMEDVVVSTVPEPATVAEPKTFTRPKGDWTQDLGGPMPERPPNNSAGEAKKGNGGIQATPEPPPSPADRQPGDDSDDEAGDHVGPLVDALAKKLTIENERGMKENFSRAFREALPKRLQPKADELRHQWLGLSFFLDKDGNPSSGVILKAEFEQWKQKACEWARMQK